MSKFEWPDDWFVDTQTVSFDPTVARRMGPWWHRTIFVPHGISPTAFGDMLIEDLPGAARTRFLSFSPDSVDKVSLEFSGTLNNTLVVFGGHTLTVTPTRRMLEPDMIGVDPAYQGHGIGTTVLRNLHRAALRVGVGHLGIKAGLEVGAYVWVKFGFFPTEEEWSRIKPRIRSELAGLCGMVSSEAREEVALALAAPSGKAIVTIAALEDAVLSRSQAGVSREVTLGLALLADSGAKWYGELSFEDVEAMAISRNAWELSARSTTMRRRKYLRHLRRVKRVHGLREERPDVTVPERVFPLEGAAARSSSMTIMREIGFSEEQISSRLSRVSADRSDEAERPTARLG